jgi:hypothetical protein
MNLKERLLTQKKMYPLIEQWLKEQESPPLFCKANNISRCQFDYWRKKYIKQYQSKKGFAAIKVEPNTNEIKEQKIEIKYSNGMIIQLPEFFSLDLLQFLSNL